MGVVSDFIYSEAMRRGIDGGTALTVARSEGGTDDNDPARRGTFSTGSSWWPFQLHYGGAGYEWLGTVAGMGNDFTRLTGWQPGDERAWKDSVRYALNQAQVLGWSPWYGAAHVGIGKWDGIQRGFGPVTDEWDYLGGPDSPTSSGDRYEVHGTGGTGLRVRSSPGLASPVLHVFPEGTKVVMLTDWDAVENKDGYFWLYIAGCRQGGPLVGYAASDYLRQV